MTTQATAQVHIGTAGWSIPVSQAVLFLGAGTHLERYAAVFDAVEINSSFYRSHRRTTYLRWASCAPSDFRFAVKAPKTITHQRRLADCAPLIDAFADEIGGLGDKLGVVLVQLPPSLAFDIAVVERFFDDLRQAIAAPIACEPRHPSWFTDTASALLTSRQIARVAADPPAAADGEHPGGFPALAYYRLHGSPRMYYSAYAEERLAALAARIANPRGGACQTWCIFDNTAAGAAAPDGLMLKRLLAGVPQVVPPG